MVKGRPREFDKEQAAAAALDVFWRKGYEGTTCEELLEAMDIKPGSMYAAFGDKRALYDVAFELYCQKTVEIIMNVLEGPGSPLGKVRSLVEFWGEHMTQPHGKGCFIDSALIEFGQSDQGVANMARNIADRLRQTIETQLVQAKEIGELQATADPRALAAFLVNTKQGLTVMARAGTDKETIQGVIQTSLSLLQPQMEPDTE